MPTVIVDSALYVDGVRRPGTFDPAEADEACVGPDAFAWIGLFEPTKPEFAEVRDAFHLPELAVEDALKAHQRPKLEHYEDTLFVVLKTARYLDQEEDVEFGEIQVFLGRSFVVPVRHGAPSKLVPVRASLEHRPELLRCGPSAVLYGIVDVVVDGYEPVVRGLENDINEVEREVFSRSGRANPVERVYQLKRTVLELHDCLEPLLEPLRQLSVDRFQLIHDDTQEYFRDVHDHLVRLVDRVDQFRELLTSILAANLTQVGIHQNEDMRKISAWVAIAAVPTAIAGIYGMNFEHMPELRSNYGYPLVLGLMLALCLYLYRRFKRSGWL
jgi:magnesium transporter